MNPNAYISYISAALAGLALVAAAIAWLRILRELRRSPASRFGFSYERAYSDRILIDVEERVGIRLTAGARDMLLIPLVEARSFAPVTSWTEAESLERILRSMAEDPSDYDRDGEQGKVRSSLSVIRAFWKNFCNIPPFCDGRERG